MGFFSNLFKKTTAEVQFEQVEHDGQTVLENQNDRLTDFSDADLEMFLDAMFEDEDQFVTLTLPEARFGVRYVQACQVDDGINVQLGIEENENTKLVEKICSVEECVDIFMQFYDTRMVSDLGTYTPVEFLR